MTKPEDREAVKAAAFEVMKMLNARGFDTDQSCQAVLIVVGTLVAEGCRGDTVCLDDTLARFGGILRQVAEDALGGEPDKAAVSMAQTAHLSHARELVDQMLAEEQEDGYQPLMTRLAPEKGCRLCAATSGTFQTTVVRKRLAGRKVTVWAIMTLCADCVAAPESKDKALALLAEATGPEAGE